MSIPNYKEAAVAGTKRVRCSHITLYNNTNNDHHASFHEEEILELGDGEVIARPKGQLSVSVDAEKTIAVGDKTFTYGEVYGLLTLIYLQEAAERDVREAEFALERKARELLAEYRGDKEYTLEDVIAVLRSNPDTVL